MVTSKDFEELELMMGDNILSSIIHTPDAWKFTESSYGFSYFTRGELCVRILEKGATDFNITIPSHSYAFTNIELIKELRNHFLAFKERCVEEKIRKDQENLINTLEAFFLKNK